jgi:hypothetical protein
LPLSAQSFYVSSSTPPDGGSISTTGLTPVQITLNFTQPLDTTKFLSYEPPYFLRFLFTEPKDSIIPSPPFFQLSSDLKSITFYLILKPNTDYCFVLTDAYSQLGARLEKFFVLNFTTASGVERWSVSGTLTLPSQKINIPDISNLNLKIQNPKEMFSALDFNDSKFSKKNVDNLKKIFSSLNLQMKPMKIASVDPNLGVVVLLDKNPLTEPNAIVKYAANVGSDFSFTIRFVRNGTYYLFAGFDTQRDGILDPRMGDLILFYDANGDGTPDPITVNNSNVSGLNVSGAFQIRPFTINEKLPEVKSLAQNYASDAKLRAVQTIEGALEFSDSLDGKVYYAQFYFYSPTKGWFSVYTSIFEARLDTMPSPIEDGATVDLPNTFVDSDVVFDSAEANGGYQFRNEPNTITIIFYELRNYLGEQMQPDTVNPYWRVSYYKSDTSFNPLGSLLFYIDPSNGRVVRKFVISFKPVTAKEKFNDVDLTAKNYASDAQLKYAFGIEDSVFDGKCYIWNYGYNSPTKGKFSVFLSLGLTKVDTTWLLPFNFNTTISLLNYLDSDSISAIAERNGGSAFRSLYQNITGGYLYGQGVEPFDTTRIYAVGIYNGIEPSTRKEKNLFVLIDPITGQVLSSFTKVEKDEAVGIPTNFALYQNYPNPFNPATTITYDLPVKSNVKLIVYNILGQEVATLVNGEQEAGRYNVKFDASGLPSGVYFYKLEAGKYVEIKKMILMK